MKPAKILLFCLSLILILPLVSLPVKADCEIGPWYEQTPCQFYERVKGAATPENEIFGERYTYAQINWIFNSLVNMAMPQGISTSEQLQEYILQIIPRPTGDGGYTSPTIADYGKLGLPGLLAGGITETISHPPASGVQYIAQAATKFQVVPSAYAQGYGYGASSVAQTLWGATRNMAYLIAVILLIAAGFAIMFRVKINPQTVVSIQTMIPKLIITLILITFSYAIAGLVIDLVYVLISLIISIMALPPGAVITPTSIADSISWFTSSSFSGVVIYYTLPWLALALLGGGIGALLTIGTGGFSLGATIAGAVVFLIAIIFFIWILFKVWWMLIKTQLTIIFLIIAGPLQIMLDLIPGQSGFSSWFRNIIANASVFVVVPVMIALSMLFWTPFLGLGSIIPDFGSFLERIGLNPLGTTYTGIAAGTPLPNLPFVSGNGAIFNFAAGYVILSLIPKAAEIVREALKAPTFKYGSALKEALAPVGWAYGLKAGRDEVQRKYEMEKALKATKDGQPSPDLQGYRRLLGEENVARGVGDWIKKQTGA